MFRPSIDSIWKLDVFFELFNRTLIRLDSIKDQVQCLHSWELVQLLEMGSRTSQTQPPSIDC
ncbi:hypothetical protein SynMITS9220_02057 [Synechococcus sp. MIT S9220]|nr:hypothetical protein SynMITS9220_02057 [Synechococcus sp. MIT S9220]